MKVMKNGFKNNIAPLLSLCFAFFLFQATLSGQEPEEATPCDAYERLITEAEAAVSRNDFGLAIKKYNAAKVCNPAAGLEINDRILNAFARIDEQRLDAERNALKAQKAEREALFQAEVAHQKEQEAQDARQRAEQNEQFAREQEAEARAYLSEIYLREGQRAVADKAWDKALVNFYRAYENDTVNAEILQRCYLAADSVLPELLSIRRAGSISEIQFSPDGQYLVSASSGNLQFFNLQGFYDDYVLRSSLTIDDFFFSAPEDSIVATWSRYYGAIRFWHLGRKEELSDYQKNLYPSNMFFDSEQHVFGYSNSEGRLALSELASDSLLSWIDQSTKSAVGLDYLPSKKLIATTNPQKKENSVSIIDISEIHQGKVKFMNTFGAEISEARFHPDGQMIATRSLDNIIRIVDLATGLELEVFREPREQFAGGLRFSKDGNYFLYAVNDTLEHSSNIVLYKRQGEGRGFWKHAVIRVQRGLATALDISPEGKWCAAVVDDRAIKLWPVEYRLPGSNLNTLQSLIYYGIPFTVDRSGAYYARNDTTWAEDMYRASEQHGIAWLPEGGYPFLDVYRHNLYILKNGRQFDALTYAVIEGDHEKAEALLQRGANPVARNEQGINALLFAAYKNDLALFREMARGLSRRQLEREFLWSVNNGPASIPEFFLANGFADANCRDEGQRTALHLAVYEYDTVVVKVLLRYGADPNIQDEQGYTPLLVALLKGNYDMARQLAGTAQQADIRDDQRLSGLMIAARNNYLDVAQALLDQGADVNARDKEGWTPLHFAVYNGYDAMARLLLSHGATIDARNNYGATPLHLAAERDSAAVVRFLLDNGAELDAKTDDYQATPLLFAIGSGNLEVVELLLSRGADPNIHSKGTFSALLHAKSLNKADIYNLLLRYGAKIEKWVMRDTLYFSGEGTNVTANATANVRFTLYAQDTLYRAVGRFDGVSLFGSFDVQGKEIDCSGEELCLQFKGLILNGDGKDGFPKGTSTPYVMSLVVSPKEATGTYHIGEVLNTARDYEQYGIINVKAEKGGKKHRAQ